MEATTHRPGSAGKLRVIIERANRGEPLFHPDDAGEDLERIRERADQSNRPVELVECRIAFESRRRECAEVAYSQGGGDV